MIFDTIAVIVLILVILCILYYVAKFMEDD